MTNSPSFDQQLAINTYWKGVNGLSFQPGTIGSADRSIRISWSLNAAQKEKDPRLAVATAFSLIRSISVPLGLADPEKPNITATIWRTVSDTGAKRYFFESSYSPSIFWVDVAKLKLAEGSAPARLDLSGHPILSGEVSDKFAPAEPFKFLSRCGLMRGCGRTVQARGPTVVLTDVDHLRLVISHATAPALTLGAAATSFSITFNGRNESATVCALCKRMARSRTRRATRLGEIPPRPIVEGVGDGHPSVGALTGIHGLAIGMIAPDKLAPARRKLIEGQRRPKAEFRRDFGRRIAGTPDRFA